MSRNPSPMIVRPRPAIDPPGSGPARLALAALALLLATAAAAQPGPRAAPDRMLVTGRVLDASGKPVPGAAVMAIVQSKLADRPVLARAFGSMSAHHGRCDDAGRFRVELPRTSSARHDALTLTALAAGHGVGWAELDPDADSPVAEIALHPEQVIRGRLFDLQGKPARGVALRVQAIIHVARGDVSRISRPDAFEHPWRDLPAWPGPAISDDEGRFALRGIGRGLTIPLIVDDPRYALQATMIRTVDDAGTGGLDAVPNMIRVEPGPDPKPIAIALQPARTLSGLVTRADTGRPVPRAVIAIGILRYEADDRGRFRAAVPAIAARIDRFLVQAQDPEGAPYLIARKRIEWPRGAVEHPVDITLNRGVVVRGKVVEEGTGRPVAGAIVRLVPYTIPDDPSSDGSVPAATAADGSYRIAGPAGPGCVVVQGPDDDYALREFGGDGGPFQARPGHGRLYAHAYRAVELKPGESDQEVDLALRRGAAVHGRAVDPEGRPVRDARIFCRLIAPSMATGGWRSWRPMPARLLGQLHDGRFALHGLDPDAAAEVPAYFLDPGRKLGATARFSGRSASGPVTVRLEPCGRARARLVGPDGKPLERYPAGGLALMAVTPGPPYRRNPAKDDPLFADEAAVASLDPVNYWDDFQSDAQGRLIFPALIPGASYRIVDNTPAFGGGDPALRKEFTVKPGEALDLGDIAIARPRRSD